MNWDNKSVLVTGAAGFIGSALSKRLVSMGATVVCVDDLSFGKADKMPAMTEKTIVDVSTHAFFKTFKEREIDYIFHFGAPCTIRMFNDNPKSAVQNTVFGFENVLRVAESTGARLVYPSSGNVYGEAKTNSESIRPQPTNLYAVSKLICELMANRSPEVRSVGLRIFAGYGPGEEHKGEYGSVVSIFLDAMLKGKSPIIWGDGSQTRDFIYIDDVVDGIVAAAKEKMFFRVINVGTGKSTSFNSLVGAINDALQTNIKPKYVDRPKSYVKETKADVDIMRKHLRIKPRPLFRGLSEYIEKA